MTSHPLCIFVSALALGSLAWAEPPKMKLNLKDLKPGPVGYRIVSTDFEAEPQRQIVATLSAKGEIMDIRGRFPDAEQIEEWSVHYHAGVPVLAQLKQWRKISMDKQEVGEALVKVVSFLAQNGKWQVVDEASAKRIEVMEKFAESKAAEPSGATPAK